MAIGWCRVHVVSAYAYRAPNYGALSFGSPRLAASSIVINIVQTRCPLGSDARPDDEDPTTCLRVASAGRMPKRKLRRRSVSRDINGAFSLRLKAGSFLLVRSDKWKKPWLAPARSARKSGRIRPPHLPVSFLSIRVLRISLCQHPSSGDRPTIWAHFSHAFYNSAFRR